VEGFPPASEPLKVALLSDFHLGPYVREKQVRAAVQAANEEEPDLVALTGDYVTLGESHVDRITALLAPLHAPLGVFAVLGNHDHQTNKARLLTGLSAAGVQVLDNESRVVEMKGRVGEGESDENPGPKGNFRFALVGVDDLWRGKGDVAKAMAGVPESLPALVLSHNPDAVYGLQERGLTLVLAGHTHGGQFFHLGCLILKGTELGKRYPYGLHRFGQAQIYITSGVGTTFLPIRMGCPAEVAVLRIAGPG